MAAYENEMITYEQELANWNSLYGSNDPDPNPDPQDPVSTRTSRTGERVEDIATGVGASALAPKAAVAETGTDAAGNPLLNLITDDDDVEKISDRDATAQSKIKGARAVKGAFAQSAQQGLVTPQPIAPAKIEDVALTKDALDPTVAAQGLSLIHI